MTSRIKSKTLPVFFKALQNLALDCLSHMSYHPCFLVFALVLLFDKTSLSSTLHMVSASSFSQSLIYKGLPALLYPKHAFLLCFVDAS